jgi:hypothetical protein
LALSRPQIQVDPQEIFWMRSNPGTLITLPPSGFPSPSPHVLTV